MWAPSPVSTFMRFIGWAGRQGATAGRVAEGEDMSSSALEDRAINTAQDARKRRLPLRGFAHLDALRAGAVMLVVVSHAGVAVVPGGSGVTVFFVISGFIITHLLLREYERHRSFDVLGFYSRRALKIFPPLLVIVIVPSLIYGAVRAVSWFDVAGQLLFFFNWAYVDSQVSVLPGSVEGNRTTGLYPRCASSGLGSQACALGC